MHRRSAIAAGTFVASSLLAGTVPAIAAPVTIGPDLKGMTQTPGCPSSPGGCALLQQALPAGRLVRAPFDGVIVRWHVIGKGRFQFFTAHVDGKSAARRNRTSIVREGKWATKPTTFTARTRIAKDEHVGLLLFPESSYALRMTSDAHVLAWTPPLATGRLEVTDLLDEVPLEVGLQVEVEPDADADGWGDDSQDRCPAQGGDLTGCPAAPAPAPGPTPVPAPAPPPPPPADTAAPALVTTPKLAPRVIRRSGVTRLQLHLDEPARVQLSLRRRGHHRYGRRQTLVRNLPAAPSEIRISGRRLRAGSYRLTIRARDTAGNAATIRHMRFRVR